MKSATGLTGSGSRDWFIQRVSAVVLAAYTVVLFGWILCKGGFDYQQWAGFMMTLPMKIFLYWQFYRLSHTHGLVCGKFSLTMSLLVKWVLQRKVYALY